MSGRRFVIGMLVVLVIASAGSMTSGAPKAKFVDPIDHAMLTDHAVNVTGNASGSDGRFFQGDQADFELNSMDSLVLNATGHPLLERKVSDNFDDNSLDTDIWIETFFGSMMALEEGKVLHMKGSVSTMGSDWHSYVRVVSNRSVTKMISADLKSLSGTGGAYRTYIALVDLDSGDYVRIGRTYDEDAYGKEVIEWGSCITGINGSGSLGAATMGSHNYMITYASGKVHVLQDGVDLKTFITNFGNTRFYIVAGGKSLLDSVDAKWDNAISDYYTPGTLVSTVHDTRSLPPVLRSVTWNATITGNTLITMQVRSSSSADMSKPTAWTTVQPGQTTGLPTIKRYIQYMATLISTNGVETPVLTNVTLTYHKAVTKVELSVDGKATWLLANGLDPWYELFNLPENDTTIWVRVTDVANDTNVTSIKVSVDTTPPEGTIAINGGAQFTTSTQVRLSLLASDRYGVAKMMFCATEDFNGSVWQDYSTSMDFTLPVGDGLKYVFAKFMDSDRWESKTVNDTILLDTSPPVAEIAIDNGSLFTNSTDVELHINATDLSGVADMMVSQNSNFGGASWAPFQERSRLTLNTGDGDKRVYVILRDVLGHISQAFHGSIALDTTPPVGSVYIDGGATYTNSTLVDLSLLATDASGLAYMAASESPTLTGAQWVPYQGTMRFTLTPGDGQRTVYVSFRDVLWQSSAPVSASITLKTSKPEVSLVLDRGEVYTRSRLVSIALTAGLHGPATRLQLGEDPSLAGATIVPFKANASITVSAGDGRKTVYARVFDTAGNAGPIASASIILDTTPPTVTLKIDGGAGYTNSTTLGLDLVVTDSSGASTLELDDGASFSNKRTEPVTDHLTFVVAVGDGKKTVYVRAIDLAGNVGPTATASIFLDTVPPVLTLRVINATLYTRSRELTLALDVLDSAGVDQMLLWEGASAQGATPVPYTATTIFTLSEGDGEKTVHVRVRDTAGNWGTPATVTVGLDSTAPTSTIHATTPRAGKVDVTLTWLSNDAGSGAGTYDVQYREGTGPWVGLLNGTTATSTVFQGKSGHKYEFRVRAIDKAGNAEPLPEDASHIAVVKVPSKSTPGLSATASMVAVVAVAVATGVRTRSRHR